jgi:hypothetical protein
MQEASITEPSFPCFEFTPYNPENPSLQIDDEGNFKSKDKEKPRPLGRGYTGFYLMESLPNLDPLSHSPSYYILDLPQL